jgi:hypothetical protein
MFLRNSMLYAVFPKEYGAVDVAYSLSITRRGGESVDSSSAVLFKRMGADLAVAKGSQEGEGERQLCFVRGR